jgi:hypothetical protein
VCGDNSLSLIEIEDVLTNLSLTDRKKLLALYRQLGPERLQWGPEDLLQQVISEMFAGKRSWRRDLPPLVFLRGAGRSILWRERKRRRPELLAHQQGLSDIDVADSELATDGRFPDDAVDQSILDKAVAEILSLFNEAKDSDVLCLIREKLKRGVKKSIMITCQLTEAMYLAAETKLKYRVRKKFPEGLKLWGIGK